jgi:hypothetical protein
MTGLSDIQHKIEMLMFNHMVADGHIIDDEGVFNVPVETGNNVRYTFTDTCEYGQRSDIDIKKLLFLNEAMEIMTDLHLYIHHNDPTTTPMYFIPEQVMTEQAKKQAQLKIQILNHEKEQARIEHQRVLEDNQKKLMEQQLAWQKQIEADAPSDGHSSEVEILESDMDAMAL